MLESLAFAIQDPAVYTALGLITMALLALPMDRERRRGRGRTKSQKTRQATQSDETQRGFGARMAGMLGSVLLAIVLSMTLKAVFAVSRPCAGWAACPPGFSMPSMHTAVAFAIAYALIGSRRFYPAALFALRVGYSRLVLGVHTPLDIAAGMAVGLMAAAFFKGGWMLVRQSMTRDRSDRALARIQTRTRKRPLGGEGDPRRFDRREWGRKIIHALIGIGSAGGVLLLGQAPMAAMVSGVLVIGSVVYTLKAEGARIPIVDGLLARFERPDVPAGQGALRITGAVLFIVCFFGPAQAAALLLILGLGDAAAALVGKRWGRRRHAHNPKKSWEGTVAFVLASSPALLVGGGFAFGAILIGAALESLDVGVDDNLLIALGGVAAYALLSALGAAGWTVGI